MPWSYDPSDSSNAVNRIRLAVGDTDPGNPELQDEEIQSFVDATSSDTAAATLAARALAGRYARAADKWVGDLKILASQKHQGYLNLAAALADVSQGQVTGRPWAGGIRYSQKEAVEADSDLVVPSFRIGMDDNV